ncbi:MAG TPA: AI-2E family transporter [Geobacteraceae bacterium]
MERSSQIESIAATVIIAFLALASYRVVRPFLPAVLWAIICAVSSWPFYTRVEQRLAGRRSAAAGVVTLVFVVVFVLPLGFVGMRLVEEITRAIEVVTAALQRGVPPLPSWVGQLPLVGEQLSARWTNIAAELPDLAARVEPYLGKLAPNAWGPEASAGTTTGLVLLSMIMLYCFLREGHAIKTSLERMVLLLGGEKGVRLLRLAAATMSSVVYGILGSAIIQGVLAAVGFWVAGVPNGLLLSTVVFVLAVITLGMTGFVLLPVAGWLFYTGRTGWGSFMMVWAVLVGGVDNYIRPAVISRGTHLPFIVVFLGVLGGVAMGGFLGLFIGTTVLGIFFTLLREWSATAGPVAPADDAAPRRD